VALGIPYLREVLPDRIALDQAVVTNTRTQVPMGEQILHRGRPDTSFGMPPSFRQWHRSAWGVTQPVLVWFQLFLASKVLSSIIGNAFLAIESDMAVRARKRATSHPC
jgi:hypothetical protein